MKKIYLPLLCTAVSISAFAETQESWSLLTGPDGKTWSVQTVADMINNGNEWYDDFVYNTIEVTVADASHQTKGVFTIDVAGMNANDVSIFGPISNHLFNNDDQYELGVQIHIPGNSDNNYTSQNIFRAYSLDGTVLMEENGNAMIEESSAASLIVMTEVNDGTAMGHSDIKVLAPSEDGIALKKTFSLDNQLTNYLFGSVITPVKLSDGIHYVLTYYEKPLGLVNEYGEPVYDPITWMPLWTPDNHFVIENYNENFELVNKELISADMPEGINTRMMGLGSFGDQSITEGYFTGDSKYNYALVIFELNQWWAEQFAIEVYAQEGQKVATLSENNIGYWSRLSQLEGEADQWIFVESDSESGMEQLRLLDVPSLNVAALVPSEVDGKLISTNIDRFADATGYKYIMGLNEPDIDAEENLYAQYGIYNKDFTVDQYVAFNMGPRAEAFNPLINNQSLDPHLFYTDDQREFIFMAKIKGADNHIYNTLFIGNESGEVLNTYSGDNSTKGDIAFASILNYGTDQPELFISYYDENNDIYTNEFISLPLNQTVAVKQIKTGTAIQSYNLQGQRILSSAPGLSISNGKKIFNRN